MDKEKMNEIELTEKEMKQVSGGNIIIDDSVVCPFCGHRGPFHNRDWHNFFCRNCERGWDEGEY